MGFQGSCLIFFQFRIFFKKFSLLFFSRNKNYFPKTITATKTANSSACFTDTEDRKENNFLSSEDVTEITSDIIQPSEEHEELESLLTAHSNHNSRRSSILFRSSKFSSASGSNQNWCYDFRIIRSSLCSNTTTNSTVACPSERFSITSSRFPRYAKSFNSGQICSERKRKPSREKENNQNFSPCSSQDSIQTLRRLKRVRQKKSQFEELISKSQSKISDFHRNKKTKTAPRILNHINRKINNNMPRTTNYNRYNHQYEPYINIQPNNPSVSSYQRVTEKKAESPYRSPSPSHYNAADFPPHYKAPDGKYEYRYQDAADIKEIKHALADTRDAAMKTKTSVQRSYHRQTQADREKFKQQQLLSQQAAEMAKQRQERQEKQNKENVAVEQVEVFQNGQPVPQIRNSQKLVEQENCLKPTQQHTRSQSISSFLSHASDDAFLTDLQKHNPPLTKTKNRRSVTPNRSRRGSACSFDSRRSISPCDPRPFRNSGQMPKIEFGKAPNVPSNFPNHPSRMAARTPIFDKISMFEKSVEKHTSMQKSFTNIGLTGRQMWSYQRKGQNNNYNHHMANSQSHNNFSSYRPSEIQHPVQITLTKDSVPTGGIMPSDIKSKGQEPVIIKPKEYQNPEMNESKNQAKTKPSQINNRPTVTIPGTSDQDIPPAVDIATHHSVVNATPNYSHIVNNNQPYRVSNLEAHNNHITKIQAELVEDKRRNKEYKDHKRLTYCKPAGYSSSLVRKQDSGGYVTMNSGSQIIERKSLYKHDGRYDGTGRKTNKPSSKKQQMAARWENQFN